MSNTTSSENSQVTAQVPRCPMWGLNGKVQCINDVGHEHGMHQYDPDEIRRAFPKWTNEEVVARSFVSFGFDDK